MKLAAFSKKDGSSPKWQWILIGLGVVIMLLSAVLWWNDWRQTAVTPSTDTAEAATEAENSPANDFISLALTRARSGDAAGALEALDVAIASDPDNAAEAYYYRGLIKAEQGDLGGALDDMDMGIAADQHMPELYAARGT
ncbi:MAG TPA: hypothetical protein EYH05_00640, partial [Anaerolineae bacterium]|nr:hypothetical protein [Anaerolineae bacterium]